MNKQIGVVVALCFLLPACATFSGKNTSGDKTKGTDVDVHSELPKDVNSFRESDPTPPELQVAEFDAIPNDINPAVEKWVNYFTGRGREHMERYLSRSTRYEKLMKKILRENGMPEDLLYIALIESGFSPKAMSRAAAVGYWQFIRGTGKRYGLEINSFVDERRDPVLATQAAADYFKGLYSEFNSWYLSMASYNVGEGRVRREVRKNKTNDFWALAKKRRLPRETLNYVPKFLAARLIAKNPEHYGFIDLPYEAAIEFDTVSITEPLNLKVMAEKMEIDYAEMKRLNPKYRGEIVPIARSGKIDLRIPVGYTNQAIAAAQVAKIDQVVFIADKGEADVYRVRRGDTLGKIARKFKTNIAYLRDLNNLSRKSSIRAGRTIFVPLIDDRPVAYQRPKKGSNSDGLFYVAQSGDTLIAIADKYEMSLNELKDINEIESGFVLKAGARLKVKKIDESENASPAEVAAAPDIPAAETKEAPELTQAPPLEAQIAAQPSTVTAVEAAPQVLASNSSVNTDAQTQGTESSESQKTHTVKPGENLTVIAKKYGTTVGALKKANKIGRRSVIRAGILLVIPADSESQKSANPTMNSSLRQKPKDIIHIVKKGDTLIDIAEKYGVEVGQIRSKNRIARKRSLFAGARLVIPVEATKQ